MRHQASMDSIEGKRVGILYVLLALAILIAFSTSASAEPVAFTVSYGNLHTIDLETGGFELIGPTGLLSPVQALTQSPEGLLYAVSLVDDVHQLVVLDEGSGVAAAVGPLGIDVAPTGLSFDPLARLWMTTMDALYRVDSETGAATLQAVLERRVTSLTVRWKRMFVFTSDDVQGFWLEQLDPGSGELTPLWDLNSLPVNVGFIASSFDSAGTLWFLGQIIGTLPAVVLTFFKMPDLSTGEAIETFSEQFFFGEPEAGMLNMALPQWPKLLSAQR